MSLRRRIGLLSALAVSLTVLVASIVTYAVVRGELHGQIDDALRRQAQLAERAAVALNVPAARSADPPIGSRRRRRHWARRRRSSDRR